MLLALKYKMIQKKLNLFGKNQKLKSKKTHKKSVGAQDSCVQQPKNPPKMCFGSQK